MQSREVLVKRKRTNAGQMEDQLGQPSRTAVPSSSPSSTMIHPYIATVPQLTSSPGLSYGLPAPSLSSASVYSHTVRSMGTIEDRPSEESWPAQPQPSIVSSSRDAQEPWASWEMPNVENTELHISTQKGMSGLGRQQRNEGIIKSKEEGREKIVNIMINNILYQRKDWWKDLKYEWDPFIGPGIAMRPSAPVNRQRR